MNVFLVLSAVNAKTGIDLAAKERPDLILMDIQLPGMNGLEATRSLKADEALRELPVVALSGFASDGDRQDAFLFCFLVGLRIAVTGEKFLVALCPWFP